MGVIRGIVYVQTCLFQIQTLKQEFSSQISKSGVSNSVKKVCFSVKSPSYITLKGYIQLVFLR